MRMPSIAQDRGPSAHVDKPMDAFSQNVRRYRYRSPNLSLLESLFLNEFWEKVATLYPKWLAPNIVSLSGLICVLIATCVSLWHSPSLHGDTPSWAYVVLAALFFAYQTLDGSDGKQARRTGSGSPLGELVDHGIDAATTPLIAWFCVDCLAFGVEKPQTWMVVLFGPVGFTLSNLVLLHRGTQFFGVLDIIEMQTCMIGTLLVTAAAGPEVWRTEVFGYEVRDIYVAAGSLMVLRAVALYLWELLSVYLQKEADRPAHVRAGWAGTGPASAAAQVAATAALQASWWATWAACGTTAEYLLLLAMACSSQADTMDRILVTRVAGEGLPALPPGVVLSIALAAASHGLDGGARVAVMGALVAASAVSHLAYFFSNGGRIARACGIHPLRVGKPLRDE
eukprot:TRINITY_DN5026_c0_g1_i2.p1 TRINITY_DN5026_c0_g1~~TRINITY_DN5026_c0_g1_i2.p1  ORF type:complete len:436 (+),score=117.30 TRINITY_DN5026_c0_g1_i2:121-1308(+)